MKKIIVTTGYMGSGSSAVTDLVAEFKNCNNEHNSYEYVFLHCPDGLFDLEDRLLMNNNTNRSDEALRTFHKRMQELYNKKFWWVGNYQNIIGKEFMVSTEKFIQNITQFKFQGHWYMHERVNFKMFCKLLLMKPVKMLLGSKNNLPKITRYKNEMMISYISPDKYYEFAKRYVKEVIDQITKDSEMVVLDQLLLPFNLYRMHHYFDDNVYAIVVDRDPRDVFILNKYIWPQKNATVPVPLSAQMFCEYYKAMRSSEKPTDNKQVLRVHFEDLVYDYETTVATIREHLGVSEKDHVNKKKRFDPALSIKNTQLFHSEQYQAEVQIIEKELKNYLYDFPYEVVNAVENTVEFE